MMRARGRTSARTIERSAAAAPALAALLVGACGGGGRDVVTPSTDVVGSAAPSTPSTGYDYVARRPFAVVALAEARGIEPAIARAAVDHLADAIEDCVSDAQRRGAAVDGAARVVAEVDPGGAVANATIRVDPKAGAAATGVVCFLAPTRLLVFPASARTGRGLAVEAIWGSTPTPGPPR
jgi:hypothetical protein